VKSILAGIAAFILSIFGGQQVATHSASQAASAAVAVTSSVPSASTPTTSATSPTTIINQPVIERIIEQAPSTVTEGVLNARLQSLADSFKAQSPSILYIAPSVSGPGAPLSAEAFAPSQAIDRLTNATLNNVTVNGISGLTAADIPSLSGTYLPLTGGTLSSVLTAPIQDSGGQQFNVRAYGAKGDGTTDDGAAIQLAINTAFQLGGGKVLISGGVYAIGATITLESNVVVEFAPGATVKWIGPAGGTMFTTDSSVTTVRTGLVGGSRAVIDPNGTAGYVFYLHSMQSSDLGGLEILSGTATTIDFELLSDSGGSGTHNTVYNHFHDITVSGTSGIVFQLKGTGSGQGVVTLNSFDTIGANSVNQVGQ